MGSNGTGMEDGISGAVMRSNEIKFQSCNEKQRNGQENAALGVVGGIVIRGLGPCFYLSPFGMRLRGVSIYLTRGDPDPESPPYFVKKE